MNGQGERWTAEQVLALAPDAASQKAGSKLGTATPWSGCGLRDGALWGLCKGSGSKPYRTVIDLSGPAYRCSCPSRKFPCKHALGLLLLWATGEPVPAGEPPEWATEWLASRRERAERQAAPAAGGRVYPSPRPPDGRRGGG
ncbi:SWIM zinc finger family protein, partial [Streptomyces sp. HSW2009]|uniref:SWIM zinc finger family protein n=1 Tax=Streptomyces sp. HSW2009 TaxID=3142890 RepID=UPI0032EF3F6D